MTIHPTTTRRRWSMHQRAIRNIVRTPLCPCQEDAAGPGCPARTVPRARAQLDDAVSQQADPLHLELNHIPGLEPPSIAVLQDAPASHGPRADDIARCKTSGIAGRCAQQG